MKGEKANGEEGKVCLGLGLASLRSSTERDRAGLNRIDRT